MNPISDLAITVTCVYGYGRRANPSQPNRASQQVRAKSWVECLLVLRCLGLEIFKMLIKEDWPEGSEVEETQV